MEKKLFSVKPFGLRSFGLQVMVVLFATFAYAQDGAAPPTASATPSEAAPSEAASAEPVSVKAVIEEAASEAFIGGKLAYLEDASGELTIEKIVDGGDSVAFKAYEEPDASPNFGLNPSVHWFKVQIENLAETVQWVVEVDYSMLDTITFYAQGADGSYAPRSAVTRRLLRGVIGHTVIPTLRLIFGKAIRLSCI